MKPLVIAAALGVATSLATSATAGPFADDLGKCLVNSSSPKDQAILVRWIFSAVSVNPEVRSLTNVSDAQRLEYTKAMAAVFNRLVLEDCKTQTAAALKNEGAVAFQSSFELLGKVATTSLLSDPNTTKELTGFTAYVDMEKFNALTGRTGAKSK